MDDETDLLDVKGHMDRIMLAVRFLADEPIDALLANILRAHTLGPIMDPTAYRDALYNGNLDWQEKVLRAVAPIPKLMAELLEQASDS